MKTVMKSLIMFALIFGLLMGLRGNSYGIANGQFDENGEYPYVGAILFFDPSGNVLGLCGGTLIAPWVVLTTGHCTNGAAYAAVSFDAIAFTSFTSNPIWGSPVTDPQFCFRCGKGLHGTDTHDVGVVLLQSPVNDIPFALLPGTGLVDALPKAAHATIVGYGATRQTRGVPPHQWVGIGDRYYATSTLLSSKEPIGGEFLKLTQNPAQEKGGVCFGDSGGPVLLSGTNIILGLNSFLNNNNCTGIAYSYRIDTLDALSFIESFIEFCGGCQP